MMKSGSPRVVLVLPTYLPESFGGAEQQTRRFARALARRGLAVTILAPRLKRATPARQTDGAVRIRRFRLHRPPYFGGRHMASYLVWWACILSWLWRRRAEYEVIHIIHGRLHAVPAVVAGALFGKPVLIKIGRGGRQFDLDVVQRKRLFGRSFAWLIHRHANGYVANSSEIAEDLRRWAIPEEDIYRIPNGVEFPDLDGAPRAAGEARFVFLGRLDQGKAVDLMIRGFARLPEKARAQLTIVGDGPSRKDLELLAEELGVTGRVGFIGAVEDVAPALRAADIYVSTSLSEGMSNALLEAMSFGVMPLVSRVSGVADIVDDGRSGLLFEPGDLDDFTTKLEEAVMLSIEKRRGMGAAARETVRKKLGIDDVAERHIEVYWGLIKSAYVRRCK